MSSNSQKTHAIQIRVSAKMLKRIDSLLNISDFKNRADFCRTAIRNHLNEIELGGIGGGGASVVPNYDNEDIMEVMQQILAYQSLQVHMLTEHLNHNLQAKTHTSIKANDLINNALEFVQKEHENLLKRINDLLTTL